VYSLLAMSLAAPSLHAQTAPAGAAKPAASAVDSASIQALKDMGAFLQTLKRFRVSTELTGERVLADGQKLQHTAMADMDVERPNKIRAVMHSARSERELVYDGKTVTLYTPAQKYYSMVEFSDNLGKLVDRLEHERQQRQRQPECQRECRSRLLWRRLGQRLSPGRDRRGSGRCRCRDLRRRGLDGAKRAAKAVCR